MITAPTANAELAAAITAIASEASRTPERFARTLSEAYEQEDADTREPGTVPAGFMPALVSLGRDLGYTVGTDPVLTGHMLGATTGATTGLFADPWTVRVQDGMTPVSTARTLAHEMSHAILKHTPQTDREAAQRMREALTRRVVAEDSREEVAAELAAAAVLKLAGIAGPELSIRYLATRKDGLTVSARADALTAARTMWAALTTARKQ